jgi:hypothetical protein
VGAAVEAVLVLVLVAADLVAAVVVGQEAVVLRDVLVLLVERQPIGNRIKEQNHE